MESEVEKIKTILLKYKNLKDSHVSDYISKYSNLLKKYNTCMEEYSIKNKSIAEDFNVFNILKIETQEVITHSPIIAHLLDPRGHHAQQDFFYELFLKIAIHEKDVEQKFINASYKDYFVITEKEKIDIRIESRNLSNPFIIIIENKIYADDQNEQIKKYYEIIKKRWSDDEILIFYLTRHGDDPSTSSIPKKLMEKLKAKKILYTISYKNEIKNWLEKSLENDIIAPKVKHTIEQYLQTIKTLYNER